jgi:hypothetical protein
VTQAVGPYSCSNLLHDVHGHFADVPKVKSEKLLAVDLSSPRNSQAGPQNVDGKGRNSFEALFAETQDRLVV